MLATFQLKVVFGLLVCYINRKKKTRTHKFYNRTFSLYGYKTWSLPLGEKRGFRYLTTKYPGGSYDLRQRHNTRTRKTA